MTLPSLAAAATSATDHASVLPSAWMVLPFAGLLLCIALLPLLAAHFWERHYAKVAVGLGSVTACYYLLVLRDSHAVMHSMTEYLSFMALVGSLFVISGGINIGVKGEATPLVNVVFLLFGATIANIIGTTGASMLLIRPWIRMNKFRITAYHIVFFIFVVSNCGGCLTPIGDPPLFLGFLRGIPFWWVIQQVWPAWLLCIGLLLVVFFVIDVRNFRKVPRQVAAKATAEETWTFRGLHNLLLLALVLLGVFLPQQWKVGTEALHLTAGALLMIAAAIISYLTTARPIHEANDFNFHPVKEVGWLFIGIFLTMIPALQLLGSGQGITLDTPLSVYFASGSLSAFLDNAPTYLTFLAAGMGRFQLDVNQPAHVLQFLEAHPGFIVAVSLGSVFFGAGSYIGNGPNFMVKAIAEKSGVKAPGFLKYIYGFSLPLLLPILAIVGWLMLRHTH
ncbi:UIT6 family transporter [Roseimicrobium gellanilyticum]|uniref:UIT6 family transporter n=1 Tax=Roseimicrobium gellanilyticum TaxID=748857 RepID=A0A366H613_9BACT|nr:sodium:proton antiporter [Roseimicrobium gellanilyticum]RBP37372.1 UIT6 family transporter [Roseimicrobium gellanilyticum]